VTASWLPPFIEFDGDWNNFAAYVEAVYAVFVRDFVTRRAPMLRASRVNLRRHPEFQGKSATFWHLVTEGKVEENRSPDVERCRRIAWPRAVLERAADKDAVRAWKNRRGTDERLLLAPPDFDYVVVLQEREESAGGAKYFLLLTAYPVTEAHRQRKLRAEYEAWVAGRTKS
jgi:hypothetical protein